MKTRFRSRVGEWVGVYSTPFWINPHACTYSEMNVQGPWCIIIFRTLQLTAICIGHMSRELHWTFSHKYLCTCVCMYIHIFLKIKNFQLFSTTRMKLYVLCVCVCFFFFTNSGLLNVGLTCRGHKGLYKCPSNTFFTWEYIFGYWVAEGQIKSSSYFLRQKEVKNCVLRDTE